ncbi:MAG: L-rhamnose mutarotase [Bacteroidia bacterium]
MKRYCKTLSLRPDDNLIQAYKSAHAPGKVWPEITEGMRQVGILDMEIYLLGHQLFMIMETVDEFEHDKAMTRLGTLPRQSEWEAHMAQFQNTTEEASADEKWQIMERIFKMDK